mmetsp:Transcript_23032/g.34222  ORF Transcript_23032/g.34222 Transcript_23032/m.34222 type:complete len:373 (-) Transcript_23032:71-1189(-)
MDYHDSDDGYESEDGNYLIDPTALEEFYPGHSNYECTQAGLEIGRDTVLKKLNFCDVYTVPRADWEAFMRGVANNRSIDTLEFIWCNGLWGNIFQILTPFIEQNTFLTTLQVSMSSDSMTDGEIRSLSSILQRGGGSNLTHFRFSENRLSDDIASELISSFVNLSQLSELDLRVNCIAMRGCEALAAVLRNPESKLETLKLGSNNIGNKEAEVLFEALSGNDTLKMLAITNAPQCQATFTHNSIDGWGALTKIIRDSNHTLQSVTDPDFPYILDATPVVPDELKHLITMNSNADKQAVAQQKVILFQHILGIEFEESTKQKILPNILAWIIRSYDGNKLVPSFALMRNTSILWSGEYTEVSQGGRKRAKVAA